MPRIDTPRVPPLRDEELDAETLALLGATSGGVRRGPILNIFRTLAHHPKLLKRWLVFGGHVLGKSTLPARERELAILRIGWLCRAEYEWGQHAAIGRATGLTDDEIRRIAEGPGAPGWSDFDAAILRAVDELHGDAFLSDASWKALAARWSTQQLIDFVFAVGQYNLVSMALNTLGVQLDPGVEGFPDGAAR
jgi:4-carboxymuconolactone decarboxylase